MLVLLLRSDLNNTLIGCHPFHFLADRIEACNLAIIRKFVIQACKKESYLLERLAMKQCPVACSSEYRETLLEKCFN
jgi:hypothetical protein